VESTFDLTAGEASLPAGTTRAEFCTGRYRTTADVLTGDRRLLDVMRDTTRNYLEVRRLRVCAMDSDAPEAEYTDGLINKSEVDWVAVRAEPSRAAGRLYAFVKKTPVHVTFLLGSHSIEGNVFVDTISTDPVMYFLRGVEKSAERFLAVASATISTSDGETDSAGLVIVNRNAVRLFSVAR
jgi:hypothetical protein